MADSNNSLQLHHHLERRFTAKWWQEQQLEADKIAAILKCAWLAPVKQGIYDFEIHVLTDSDRGKAFKEWLYYENTACLNRQRGLEGPGLRRYNGQVLAPMVMIWLAHTHPSNNHGDETSDFIRVNNDCHVSATMAMCQAEELGVRTGFCGCLGGREIADKLNRPDHTAVVSVGFGYAEPDSEIQRKVYKDQVEIGFDLSNTSPDIRTSLNRKDRPSKNSLIKYV